MRLQKKVAIDTGGGKGIIQINLGGIEVLVNNAPGADPENPPRTELSLKEGAGTISAKLTGVFLGRQYAVNHLRKIKDTIINIASTWALMPKPSIEADSASKGVWWQ